MFPRWGTDGLFQMADHVESFVAALKRAEPTVARVGARAADQQRESFAAALLGCGKVGGVEFGLAHQMPARVNVERFLRCDSPRILSAWALCTRRSRMASRNPLLAFAVLNRFIKNWVYQHFTA